MQYQREVLAAAALALAAGLTPAYGADAIPDYVTAAVNDPGRPPEDIARDAVRKPADLVAFSGIKPGDVVAEFVPGDGYYTRILSTLIGPNSRLYAMVPMNNFAEDMVRREDRKLAAEGITPPPRLQDAILKIENIQEYHNVHTFWESFVAFGGQFSTPERLDAVFSSDHYHRLYQKGVAVPLDAWDGISMIPVSKAIFQDLKPGGTYTVSDFNTTRGTGFRDTKNGRVDVNGVKVQIMAAGFVLDGESDMLANPNDDHTKPADDPSLGGKADRFVLRFKKPENAPFDDMRPPKGSMDGYYGNTSHSGIDSPVQRWVHYHADGTYQEYGNTGTRVQNGLWYWDAAGHNCMLHQYPARDRGSIVCHDFSNSQNMKAGDEWTRVDSGRIFRMDPGHTYPSLDTFGPDDD